MSAHLKERHLEDWDTPLPEECKPAWNEWCASLSELEHCRIPRSYTNPVVLEKKKKIELHTFCDASATGIAAVTYMKIIQSDGQVHVSFVFGKAKLAPTHATTIPRLELCATVLAVEITQLVVDERAIEPDSITYYSDSRVVLGYITNEIRRFYVYVSNRVKRIRRYSSPDQWQYVSTHQNPADVATRPVKACNLESLPWLTGPQFLKEPTQQCVTNEEHGPLQPQPNDPEVRPHLKTLATILERKTLLGANRFTRFSSLISLIRGMLRLIRFVSKYHLVKVNQESQVADQLIPSTTAINSTTIEANKKARILILKTVQHETFQEELYCLKKGKPLARSSLLMKLSPFLDENTLLCVGGRLDSADITNEERHPVIIPGSHHVARLIVEHSHIEVKHQGRHLTQGNLKAKGYWILGEKCFINKVIHRCLKCWRLRGTQQQQKMADLPVERLTPAPPFTFVGLDVFGPWHVITRRTRGGAASSKRWAVIFTCLTIRAIHIELVKSVDTSSFINALRRFFAVRGPAIQLPCDNGTNFVGARNELDAAFKEMDKELVRNYLSQQHCQ